MALATGAPSQHSQPSRKGKRAWRKNVDIQEIEGGLEILREEERVTGGHVHAKTNDQLFEIDVKGDDKVRKTLPKVSLKSLKSYRILTQRSAVPAVQSKKASMSYAEKKRMLKVGRKAKTGLFDPSQVQTVPNVVNPGEYNIWDGGIEPGSANGKQKSQVKAPPSLRPHTSITVPPVIAPHTGTSYNPPLEAHQELLRKAHEIEERREAEEIKYAGVKEKMLAVRKTEDDDSRDDVAVGMKLDANDEDVVIPGEAENASEEPRTVKISKPKTKKQRRKAAAVLVEKRLALAKAAQRRQLETITTRALKALKTQSATKESRRKQDLVSDPNGLGGKKLGKHIVPEPRVDVQLGEELSESLRALQPEGNLFKDRFESMQRRALIEPRVRILPTKRRIGIKDYEKHPWKRFT